jgi:drug/metabolite transporter (DMT)-like permease
VQYVTSGLAAVLQSGTPGFGLLLAWWLGKEEITPAKVLGLVMGAAGVAVIFARQGAGSGGRALLGCTAVLLSGISVAAGYVLLKARGSHLHPTTVITWQMWVGFVPLVALGLWREGNPLALRWTRDGVFVIAYLALFGSIGAFWLNYWLLHRMDATALLVMGIVEAPLATGLGAILLRERMDVGTYVGSLLVVAGVALVLRAAAGRRRGSKLRAMMPTPGLQLPPLDDP